MIKGERGKHMKVRYEVEFDVKVDDYNNGELTEEDIEYLSNVINCQVVEIAKKGTIKFRMKQID